MLSRSRRLVTPLEFALREKCSRKCFTMCSYRFIGLKASQNQQLQKKAGVPLSLRSAAIRREDGLRRYGVEAPEFQWDDFKAMDADALHRRPMTRKTLDRSFNRNTGQGLLISALDVQGCFRYSFRRNGASGTSPASSPPQRSTVPAEAWVANFRLHSLARWRGKRQRAFCFGGSVARCLHGFGSAGRCQTEPAAAGRSKIPALPEGISQWNSSSKGFLARPCGLGMISVRHVPVSVRELG